MLRTLASLVAILLGLGHTGAAQTVRDVTIAAEDGTSLKATYYAARGAGPAVLLLHMCNTTRASWEPLARQLADAGIHTLAFDYRGFGESGGPRFDALAPDERQKATAKRPADVDAAFSYLTSQPGVDRTRIGAGGGSCGVNQAVQLARRHPEVKSLVLLAGPTDRDGRLFLQQAAWLPVFTAAAADDQFDADAPRSMQWLAELSGNPRNTFVGFADGKHGTEIFGPHPELPRQIVAWYLDTLVRAPADPATPVTRTRTPASEFWAVVDQPGDVTRAIRMFHEVRDRDPRAFLFPEQALNLAAYERLQSGDTKGAIALFELNVEAYPQSANARDSLGDGYLADGQNDRALAAARKCLELLPADRSNEQFKTGIRENAEKKIATIRGSSTGSAP
jgi:dienelactone hydrolase